LAEAEVEVLLADLQAQAEAEREKLREETRQKVAEIRGGAEAEVRHIEEEAARRLERQLALDRERIHGRFRIEERRRNLEARRAAVALAFARARDLLVGRVGVHEHVDAYRRVLKRLVAEALEAAGRDADVEVARRDVGAAREILSSLGVSGSVRERGEEPGTIVAVSPDGLRRADNSLGRRLVQAERLLEEGVSRELFGGAP